MFVGQILYFNKRGKDEMEDIKNVAKYFLAKESMTHKKLQKLCYYAQAWYYAITNTPLVDTEFEAWVHGPVAPVLYHEYKQWGWLNIPSEPKGIEAISDQVKKSILEAVYSVYGGLTGDQLEQLTHEQEPWQRAREGYRPSEYCRNNIDLELMKKSCYDEMKKQ